MTRHRTQNLERQENITSLLPGRAIPRERTDSKPTFTHKLSRAVPAPEKIPCMLDGSGASLVPYDGLSGQLPQVFGGRGKRPRQQLRRAAEFGAT